MSADRVRKLAAQALDPRTNEQEARAFWGKAFELGRELPEPERDKVFGPALGGKLPPMGRVREFLRTPEGRAHFENMLAALDVPAPVVAIIKRLF